MATIKIKRGTSGVPTLKAGEIAVNTSTDIFYIGKSDDAAGTAFAGSGAFAALSGDQTINGAKTFGSAVTLPSGDPTDDAHAASKGYVDTEISSAIGGLASAFEYKGTIDASTGTEASPLSIEADKYGSDTEATGDYYKVSDAGYLKATTAGAATTGFYVNANDSIVYNGSGWDVIDNTNSTVASSGASITVTGSADEGFNVEVASVDGGTF